MTITQISKLESIWSPSVSIHGAPWQVNVLKIGKKDQRTLGTYLYCMSKDTTTNWSYSAIATFKLLPCRDDDGGSAVVADDNDDTIVHHLQPHIFDCNDLGFGAANLIKWNDLMDKKYRRDDTIKLEIHITVDDPTKSNRSELKLKNINRRCKSGCLTTFQLKVKNMRNLVATKSPKFYLFNMPWTLTFYKDHHQNMANFGIYLQSSSGEFPKNESFRIRMSMILNTSNEMVAPIVKKTTTQRIGSFGTLSIRNIIAWTELLKPENGFINKNAIKVEIQIKMDKMIGDGVLICKKCGNANNLTNDTTGTRTSATLQMQCVICWENFSSQEICCTPCGHLFCVSCITAAVQNRANCPLCNLEVQVNALRRLYLPV